MATEWRAEAPGTEGDDEPDTRAPTEWARSGNRDAPLCVTKGLGLDSVARTHARIEPIEPVTE